MSKRYDAIVVGAGHNGLTCAAYLAKQGGKVLVVEAAERIGGAAVTRPLHDGFSVSACAHLLYMLHPRVVRDLDLNNHGLKLAASGLPTVALAEDGRHLVLEPDRADGPDLSAGDAGAYPAFMQRMRRYAGVLAAAYRDRPPRLTMKEWREARVLAGLAWKVRRLGREDMRELLRIGAINIYDVLQEEFDSELLKGALGLDAVLGSHLGPRSPNTVLTFLHRLTGQAEGYGLAVPAGGMGAVSTALGKSAEQYGAEIRTGTPVSKVLVEAGRAAGVQLASGETLNAGLVVSGADPKTTFLNLVGAPNLETGFVRRIHNIRMRGNVAKLHLALDALPSFVGLEEQALGGRLVISPSLDYLELAFDRCKYGEAPQAPPLEITLPSVLDASLAPTGKHVLSALVPYVPYRAGGGEEPDRESIQNTIIDCIATYAPGIRDRIRHAELLTPADIEAQFGTQGGHWHQGEYTFEQFMMLRPVPGSAQYATPVDGLYLCGAGCHPGGGIMGLAGRNAAMEIIRRGVLT
jgi:phytoene dehydrogenase-like protein